MNNNWCSVRSTAHSYVVTVATLSLLWIAASYGSEVGDRRQATREAAQTFEPQPRLVALADNTALDLGRYECESRAPRMHCELIFDYSRLTYDPYAHRMLAFGGGHAATGRTDVDVFNLNSLQWESLYQTMPCEEIKRGLTDPRGFHKQTGHPVARHTYDQNVVVDIGGRGYLLMFSTEGFSGYCHPYNTRIRAVASMALDGASRRWQYSDESDMPWGFAGAADFDPISGMVVLTGGQSRGMWVYDPANQRVVALVPRTLRDAHSSNLLYFPPNQRMYLIDSKAGDVREFQLNREDWARSTSHIIETSGDKPGAIRNIAYDAKNKIIGGVKNGVFYALDPIQRRWRAHVMRTISDDDVEVGNVRHQAIDYDRINNVFIFVSDKKSGLRTWAYRYRR